MPANASVAGVRKGESIFDSGLPVGTTPPDEVQIVVSLSNPTVAGTVFTATQKPAVVARVVLVPEQARRGNTALYRTVYTNAVGQFTLPNVLPGNYKVFAWQNAEFMLKVGSRGQAMTVTPAGVAELKVQVTP